MEQKVRQSLALEAVNDENFKKSCMIWDEIIAQKPDILINPEKHNFGGLFYTKFSNSDYYKQLVEAQEEKTSNDLRKEQQEQEKQAKIEAKAKNEGEIANRNKQKTAIKYNSLSDAEKLQIYNMIPMKFIKVKGTIKIDDICMFEKLGIMDQSQIVIIFEGQQKQQAEKTALAG
jgi:hypothetical protein